MITRPLDLESKLSPPPRDLDTMFWVNVGVVMLFFSVLGSQFVLASGELVQVMELPRISSPSQGATSVVVSYRRDNMVLFEGGIYTLGDLQPRMEQYVKEHPGAVMLVRFDQAVSLQGFMDLCDLARKAGFANVLLATETKGSEESGLIKATR